MKKINFIQKIHNSSKRDCLGRMFDEKVKSMKTARKFSKDFFDGERKYGYGGYKYIPGYLEKTAKKIISYYKLNNKSNILDIGCGKGFLLFEIKKILPGIKVSGFDISKYAIKNSKKEIRENLFVYDLNKKLNFAKNKEFDLVLCLATLHNLNIKSAFSAIKEINRVGKKKYIMIDSYSNLQELFNLQCWALTANIFFSDKDWEWFFKSTNYSGEYEFIHF
ncbi:class I SAM-dependent methyltransferase [Candidatus Pelagibacter sp.]|nr:class I SAM-dependent methyltransferase [Candidatus Pelagibacter sp.]